jgi:hypothetical protein
LEPSHAPERSAEFPEAAASTRVAEFFEQFRVGQAGVFFRQLFGVRRPCRVRLLALRHIDKPVVMLEAELVDVLCLEPAMEPGKIRIDWIDLGYARGDGADWVPMPMKFKTVPR